MKITKATFECTIGMPNYSNVKPGAAEIVLEQGETLEDAWTELNRRSLAWHKKEYPHLYADLGIKQNVNEEIGPYPSMNHWKIQKDGIGPIISQEKEPEDKRIATLIADIYSCTKLSELESYQRLAKTKPELQAAYDQQHQQLIKSSSL